MKKSREYSSMPIISLSEGQQIGTVRSLVLNHHAMEVAALLIEQKGFFKDQRVIPYSRVRSVGDNAITVDKADTAEKATSLPEIITMIKERFDIHNTKVITESGKVLGLVEEFYVDPVTGAIVCLDISASFLSVLFKGSSRIMRKDLVTLGKDVIIAASKSEDRLIAVETTLAGTLKSVKDSTAQFFNSSIEKTKDLGKHFNKDKALLKFNKFTPTETIDSSSERENELEQIVADGKSPESSSSPDERLI